MRRLIVELAYGIVTALLATALLFFGFIAFMLTLPWQAFRWLELHAVFKGDRAARDRAEWKQGF